jgi:tetratricopeptide (TPR) repeat protein
MWQAPAEEVDQALNHAAGLLGDSDDETSRSILRNVRIALANVHGYLLEAMQTARPSPQPAQHARPGHGAGQAESTIAASLRAIGRLREALELLARGQQAAYASGDIFVTVRCQGIRALALLEVGRLDDARGRPEVALAALAPVLDRLRRNRFYFATWYPCRLTQVTALAMRAEHAAQAGLAAQAATELSRRKSRLGTHARAAVHARGLSQSDVGSLHQAVKLLTGGEQPLATAAAQEDLASALARRGKRDDAIAFVEGAYHTYHTYHAANAAGTWPESAAPCTNEIDLAAADSAETDFATYSAEVAEARRALARRAVLLRHAGTARARPQVELCPRDRGVRPAQRLRRHDPRADRRHDRAMTADPLTGNGPRAADTGCRRQAQSA